MLYFMHDETNSQNNPLQGGWRASFRHILNLIWRNSVGVFYVLRGFFLHASFSPNQKVSIPIDGLLVATENKLSSPSRGKSLETHISGGGKCQNVTRVLRNAEGVKGILDLLLVYTIHICICIKLSYLSIGSYITCIVYMPIGGLCLK